MNPYVELTIGVLCIAAGVLTFLYFRKHPTPRDIKLFFPGAVVFPFAAVLVGIVFIFAAISRI